MANKHSTTTEPVSGEHERQAGVRVGLNLFSLHPHMGGLRDQLIALIRSWCEFLNPDELVIFSRPDNDETLKLLVNCPVKFIPLKKVERIAAHQDEFDVLFFPFANLDIVPVSKPTVVFIPDIQERYFPDFFKKEDIRNRSLIYERVKASGSHVVTPSNFSRDALVNIEGMTASKVHVIPHSPAERTIPHRPSTPASIQPKNFLFYPALNWPHKNHERLLEALANLRRRNIFIPCLLTGSQSPDGVDLEKAIRQHHLQDSVFHLGRVTDNEIQWLYKNARALFFPSKFEGFGLPVLEALSHGAAVACSGCTSLLEIAPSECLFFNPDNVDDIATAITEIWRRTPQTNLQPNLERYSHEAVARAFQQLFQQVVKEAPSTSSIVTASFWQKLALSISPLSKSKLAAAEQHYQQCREAMETADGDLTLKLAALPSAQHFDHDGQRPVLTLITQGRNDGYMGNFLWRLSATLNKQAQNVRQLGEENGVEILLCDYGSERPIVEDLELSEDAKALVRCIRLEPQLAKWCDQDSPYSVPHAVNTAIRHAKGDHVVFVDSDTYTPKETLAKMLKGLRAGHFEGRSVKDHFFFGSRFHIPKDFHKHGPTLDELDEFTATRKDECAHDKISYEDFGGTATAYLMSREMWDECRGFDESMIHWGWYDIDLYRRLSRKYTMLDLEDVGIPFFHLEHYNDSKNRSLEQENPRKANEAVPIESFTRNHPFWGLSTAGLKTVSLSELDNWSPPTASALTSTGHPLSEIIEQLSGHQKIKTIVEVCQQSNSATQSFITPNAPDVIRKVESTDASSATLNDVDLAIIHNSSLLSANALKASNAKLIAILDATSDEAQAATGQLLESEGHNLIYANEHEGQWVALFANKTNASAYLPETPIHFFTIVLNGMPFIRSHIELFKRLPFKWHWHIVEGVSELKHDTAWSVANGGRIEDSFHEQGRSKDGTSRYLDELAAEFPNNISIYRKPAGEFWGGKTEMINAPLSAIKEPCLLWQIDVDEYWSLEQVLRTWLLFDRSPHKSSAYFFCNFYIAPNYIIHEGQPYANNTAYEWRRIWRYEPGDKWQTHEPPVLVRPRGKHELDLSTANPIAHEETLREGLKFHHYAYFLDSQLEFKEKYYGYANALSAWQKLSNETAPEVNVSQFLDWIKKINPTVIAHRAPEVGYRPLAIDGALQVHSPSELKWTIETGSPKRVV